MGAQLGVAVGLLVDDSADPVVLPRIWGDVGENSQLVDVRVVLWVEAFYLRMKGCVGGAADNRVSKVSPFLCVFFIYLRYILMLERVS